MKLRMYLDTFPNDDFTYATATSKPSKKNKGFTRIAFDLEISQGVLDKINGMDVVAEAAITNIDAPHHVKGNDK